MARSLSKNLNDEFQPGDIVLFAGRGFESRWIALVTCTPWQWFQDTPFSHIGICARDPNDPRGRVLMFESTTLCDLACEITHQKNKGTQAHLPADRIKNYDGGVWRLRLNRFESLNEPESAKLSNFLLSEIGKPYDYEGAMISATRWLRLCEWMYPTMDNMFCSYYVAAALKVIDKVDNDLNPRAYNPARLARNLQYWGTYQRLGPVGAPSCRIK